MMLDEIDVGDQRARTPGTGSVYTTLQTRQEISEYAPLHPGMRSWEVARENVIIERVIGKGAFGEVAKGRASQLRGMSEECIVALKMLKGKLYAPLFCYKHVRYYSN